MCSRLRILLLLAIANCWAAASADAGKLQSITVNENMRQKINDNIHPKLTAMMKEGNFQSKNSIKLNPLYFSMDGMDVIINDLASSGAVNLKVHQIKTDLLQNNLMVAIDLGTITLEGSNDQEVQAMPIPRNPVKISIVMRNVTATGFVGFKANSENVLEVINLNLDYSMAPIEVDVFITRNNFAIHKKVQQKEVDYVIGKYFNREVAWRLQNNVIKMKLNEVLRQKTLQNLFADDKPALTYYLDYADTSRQTANDIMDKFVEKAVQKIKDTGISKLALLNAQGWFYGCFYKLSGYAYDLSTLYRYGDFSITTNEDNIITLQGALGFRDFGAKYDGLVVLWIIPTYGYVSISATNPSVAFKLQVELKDKSVTIKDLSGHVNTVGFISALVLIFGLSPFLTSALGTIVVNIYQPEIVSEIDNLINTKFSSFIGQTINL